MSYDANGNLTAMPGMTMTYDVSNRLTSATQGSTDRYFYDPAGRRVFRKERICFYGVDGSLLGEYSPNSEGYSSTESSVYFGKRLLWKGAAYYFFFSGYTIHDDRLGSAVYDGTAAPKYFPYGDEPSTTTQNRPKFATYYREGTTGLDYAQQRYYASTLGRFTTPDPYQASGGPADPQSWNRYAYVQNDPVNYNDPEGLCKCPAGSFCTCWDPKSSPLPFVSGDFITGFGFGRAPVAHLLPKDGGGESSAGPAPPTREFVYNNVEDADLLIRNAITGLAAFLTYASGRDCANWLQKGLVGSAYKPYGTIGAFLGILPDAVGSAKISETQIARCRDKRREG
jgi:RHS repeat-associated protein